MKAALQASMPAAAPEPTVAPPVLRTPSPQEMTQSRQAVRKEYTNSLEDFKDAYGVRAKSLPKDLLDAAATIHAQGDVTPYEAITKAFDAAKQQSTETLNSLVAQPPAPPPIDAAPKTVPPPEVAKAAEFPPLNPPEAAAPPPALKPVEAAPPPAPTVGATKPPAQGPELLNQHYQDFLAQGHAPEQAQDLALKKLTQPELFHEPAPTAELSTSAREEAPPPVAKEPAPPVEALAPAEAPPVQAGGPTETVKEAAAPKDTAVAPAEEKAAAPVEAAKPNLKDAPPELQEVARQADEFQKQADAGTQAV